jgi:hypothetical protein
MTITTLNPTKDTYVSSYSSSSNYGGDDDILTVGGVPTGRRGLLEFDISGIPAGATINSATLYFYVFDKSGTGQTYYFNRTTSQFTEGSVTWNTKPAFTATNRASLWTNSTGWNSVSVTDILQDSIDAALSYHGISVHGTDANSHIAYRSKEYSTSYDVYISVDYTEAPTTLMKINIGDSWKNATAMKINIGDAWKDVVSVKQNIGDTWKTVF